MRPLPAINGGRVARRRVTVREKHLSPLVRWFLHWATSPTPCRTSGGIFFLEWNLVALLTRSTFQHFEDDRWSVTFLIKTPPAFLPSRFGFPYFKPRERWDSNEARQMMFLNFSNPESTLRQMLSCYWDTSHCERNMNGHLPAVIHFVTPPSLRLVQIWFPLRS